jgi:hypothetical protein
LIRHVYEIPESKDTEEDAHVPGLSSKTLTKSCKLNNKTIKSITDNVDVFNQNKTTLSSVMETLLDCYCAQWQSILRSCHDSMLTIMMKVCNKKKFSQRTNDMKAKALIDFLASPAGAESPELIVFCHLIGLQPKPTSRISPAWSHIATSILVAAYCEKVLRQHAFHDLSGAPTPSDLRAKLFKASHLSYQKTISLKKCMKIVQLFITSRHTYWSMLPLSSVCVEYMCDSPWPPCSLAKLCNVLLFVASYEQHAIRGSVGVTTTAEALPAARRLSSSSLCTGKRNSVASAADERRSGLSPTRADGSRRESMAFNHADRRRESAAAARTDIRRGSLNTVNSDAGTGGQATALAATVRLARGCPSRHKVYASRIDLLKGLDHVIGRVWNSSRAHHLALPGALSDGTFHAHTLTTLDSVVETIDSFEHEQDHGHGYVHMNLDDCAGLAEHMGVHMLLTDFILVMIRCWEAEYDALKRRLSKGALTAQRRDAIAGFYDSAQASLTAAEKLCIVRLLNYYSLDKELRGVDWDEVLASTSTKGVKFPFTIPESLLSKPCCIHA